MSYLFKTSTRILSALAIFLLAHDANAEGKTNKTSVIFPSNGSPPLPATGIITNGQVMISWPAGSGSWELMKQQPAATGVWTAVAAEHYRTNGDSVSFTTSIPDQPAFYRLRRDFFQRATTPILPPAMPQLPTNRLMRPGQPGHS